VAQFLESIKNQAPAFDLAAPAGGIALHLWPPGVSGERWTTLIPNGRAVWHATGQPRRLAWAGSVPSCTPVCETTAREVKPAIETVSAGE